MRFRSGIRILPEEIRKYYQETLVPKYAKPGDAPSLERLSPRIQEILLQQKVNSLLGDWVKSLQEQGQVEVLDPALREAVPAESGSEGSPGAAAEKGGRTVTSPDSPDATETRELPESRPESQPEIRPEVDLSPIPPPTRRRWRWKRHLGISCGVLVLIVIGLAIGLYYWASSSAFEDTVRRRVIAELANATGGRVEINAFRWDLLHLRVEADGITIHGPRSRQ